MKLARYKRTNIIGFHVQEIPRIDKFIMTESRLEITKGWVVGKPWVCYYLMVTEFLLRATKKFWKWIVMIVAQHYACT